MTTDPGRDELNMSDFPMCFPASEKMVGARSVTYQDRIPHPITGQPVVRSFTISVNGSLNLPSTVDEEVILGLITLHHRIDGFETPAFSFTPTEMIKLIGWRKQGWSYERLQASISLWRLVLLDFKNAWFNKTTGVLEDAHFQVIGNFVEGKGAGSRGRSYYEVTWDSRMFNSLRAGNVREFDFETYRRISKPLAKHMFRYLGRQAHVGSLEQAYDLRSFAFDKMGMMGREKLDAGQIKQKLSPGFAQLESVGFLEQPGPEGRYRKRPDGGWDVRVVVRAGNATLPSTPPAPPLPVQAPASEGLRALLECGVARQAAEKLAAEHREDDILHTVKVAREMQSKGEIKRSLAGYVVRAIPGGFHRLPVDISSRVRTTIHVGRDGANHESKLDDSAVAERIWSKMSDAVRREITEKVEELYKNELELTFRDIDNEHAEPRKAGWRKTLKSAALREKIIRYILENRGNTPR